MKQIPILFSTEMVKAILEERKSQTRRIKGLEEVINRKPEKWKFLNMHSFGRQNIPCAQMQEINSPFIANIKCPYGKPGDVLYVREKWQLARWHFEDSEATIRYADGDEETFIDENYSEDFTNKVVREFEKLVAKGIVAPVSEAEDEENFEYTDKEQPWNPGIHLPKYWSRIFLEITSIRVERLQDISEEDAIAEGINQERHDFEMMAYPDGTIEHFNPKPAVWQRMDYLKTKETGIPHYCSFSAKKSYQTLWEVINGPESWNSNPWVWVVGFKIIEKLTA